MKKIIAALIMAVMGASIVALPAFADNACELMTGDPNYELVCGGNQTNAGAQSEVGTILETVFLYVGIIAVIVMIIGGIYYVISLGDPSKVVRAKQTILYAAIGLVVTVLAFAITNFVLRAAEGRI